ncbi:hypothetical protein [Mitsuaria sp. GD03876]|uniref:hypothetical protein n=1 Tax=Mitsuaria sp. GD03876 TaxID=2975399 RepID=UPI00244AD195|nr:hypothetical protein [Mitsuaria sp. GD03876]MDH0862970.1 hypothetical protein [Mitsuaria sp. GD03876]
MVRPVNIGKRGLLQALAPSFLMLSVFSGAAAWEETPFGELSSTTATLDVRKGRKTRFVFRSGDREFTCPGSFCFRRQLERRQGQDFVIEHDTRGLAFSIGDAQGVIVSRDDVRKAFLKHVAWSAGWFLVFVLCVARLLQRRRFSDE